MQPLHGEIKLFSPAPISQFSSGYNQSKICSLPKAWSRSGSNESCHPVKSKVETKSPPVSVIKCHLDHRLPEFTSALPVPHSLRPPQGLTGDILDCQVRVWLQARVNAMFVYTSRVALVIPVKIVKYHCLFRTILSSVQRCENTHHRTLKTLFTAFGEISPRGGDTVLT